MTPDAGEGSFINGDEALKVTFINRDSELKVIDRAFDSLLDEGRLLRTPIIDFCGVGGIGKTSILREVKKRCQKRDLSCIWVDANQGERHFLLQLLNQTSQWITIQPGIVETAPDPYAQIMHAMGELLGKRPVVVLLDIVDLHGEEETNWIENILQQLTGYTNLFVVLASKQKVSFDQNRLMARKITPYTLQPFSQSTSETYLSHIAGIIEPAIRDTIIDWTHGYPLAMKVMSQAIQEQHLYPDNPEDQLALITILIEKVVDQGIFSHIERGDQPEQLEWYKKYISLLSLPRRFNLVILQDLTEQYAPELALSGKLEYMGLPRRLNRGTEILYWDIKRVGFTVDENVRHLFLKQRIIEQPEGFYQIHQFLAERNKFFAEEVTGSDRIRYLREYLYHSTFVEDAQTLPDILTWTIQSIEQEPVDSFVQFSEELNQDEELKEALGSHLGTIMTLVDDVSKRRDK